MDKERSKHFEFNLTGCGIYLLGFVLGIFILRTAVQTVEQLWQATVTFAIQLASVSLVVAVAIAIAWVGWRWYSHRQQRQEQLQAAFSHLVALNQGRISVLELALQANATSEQAKAYLDRQAQEFTANFEVDDRGEIAYLFAWSTPESPGKPESPPASNNSQISCSHVSELHQAALSRRLQVSPSTISQRKNKSDFAVWSQQKDPAGIAWTYCSETKKFYPQT
ncbi:hypothetical protein [Geitlerinema sp. PCC 9228]|jgi:type III secretory pathway component EscS|uniref:hypothetical protein n=1 Tax=Geitlerinema sp. PCC 9228 TaxID=111611 RepID=UPI0008F9DE9C|nr:hypothetical protein [Geitlerinema sp. PCC 9228]